MTDVSEAGTEDQSSPSWLFGCVILLAAMLVAGGMIFFFGLLRDTHPPVELTAATGDLTGLKPAPRPVSVSGTRT